MIGKYISAWKESLVLLYLPDNLHKIIRAVITFNIFHLPNNNISITSKFTKTI